MKSVKDIPFRFPAGVVSWEALGQVLGAWQREVLAEFDIRNAQAFPNAVTANANGTVTLGVQSKVVDQRTLPQVSAGNRLSAQSVQPLSSTGSATTAAIAVAAHTVQYGFGVVSYGSGSITGLPPATLHYVYADDPDFEGGAMAYTATTSPQTVVATNGRYYVGAITTAISSPTGNVVAASSTNPITVQSSAAHGLSNGQTVTFADMPGDFAVLNGTNRVVTVVDGDEFTVAVDGSGFAAYTTGGTFTRVSTPTTGRPGGGFEYYEE